MRIFIGMPMGCKDVEDIITFELNYPFEIPGATLENDEDVRRWAVENDVEYVIKEF